jgi:cytochrome c-type biogenesis protein CcmH/NrfG
MLVKEQYTDEELTALLAEANFHLGRVLYLQESDSSAEEAEFSRAVSELEEAVDLDPENVQAYYYLGQAIRAQVERNILKRAEDALRTYLVRGAPLGHEDDVREFLGSRMQAEGR